MAGRQCLVSRQRPEPPSGTFGQDAASCVISLACPALALRLRWLGDKVCGIGRTDGLGPQKTGRANFQVFPKAVDSR